MGCAAKVTGNQPTRKTTPMRVAIAGAGKVGQSIARAALGARHKVLLIERQRLHYRPGLVPDADWMWADACELATLQAAGIEAVDVVIAATGDDGANLVFAWLSKSQFAVPRVVARINDPHNQWMFTRHWGVDVAVSTPSTILATVQAALSESGVVRLMTLQHGGAKIVETTVPATSPFIGRSFADLALPDDAALLGVIRRDKLLPPATYLVLDADDKIVLLVAPDAEDRLWEHIRLRKPDDDPPGHTWRQ
jgi:trk system potassium uptake protein